MQASFFIFYHLHRLCKHHFLRFAICISYASILFCVLSFAASLRAKNLLVSGSQLACTCWNGRGGAYVLARTSAQRRFHTKNARMVRGDLTIDAPLAGRHGRAHRHRPYKTPSYFSMQSAHNQRPLRPRSYNTIHHLEMNKRPGNPYIILNGSCRETRITRPTYINVYTSAPMLF